MFPRTTARGPLPRAVVYRDEMSLLAGAKCRAGIVRAFLRLALALSAGWPIPAHAAAAEAGSQVQAVKRHTPRHTVRSGIEGRVKILSKGLGLDPKQQAELRKVLEGQRDQVQRIWNDPSLSGPYRVSATQAISERTADQIRALLNEEQRKKYNPPRQPHDAAASSEAGVEYWMNLSRAKQVKADPHVDVR